MIIFHIVDDQNYFAYYNISTHTFRSYIQLLPDKKYTTPFDKYVVEEWDTFFCIESKRYYLQGLNKFTLDVNLDIFKDYIDYLKKYILNDEEALDRIIDYYKTKAYDIRKDDYLDYFFMTKEDIISSIKDLDSQYRKFRRKKDIDEL